MTPLPAALGGSDLVVWRLDDARFASSWDSGEGAFRFGGRWNSPGVRVVYGALDPATAILEVAAHSGLEELHGRPHILTSALINKPGDVTVIQPEDSPDPRWLDAARPTREQQQFGDRLISGHGVVALPSVVSRNSWNLMIAVPAASGTYRLQSQEPFELDPRLRRR